MKKIIVLVILIAAVVYGGSKIYISNKNQLAQVGSSIKTDVVSVEAPTTAVQGQTISFTVRTVDATNRVYGYLHDEVNNGRNSTDVLTIAPLSGAMTTNGTYSVTIPSNVPVGQYRLTIYGDEFGGYTPAYDTVTVVAPAVVPVVTPMTVTVHNNKLVKGMSTSVSVLGPRSSVSSIKFIPTGFPDQTVTMPALLGMNCTSPTAPSCFAFTSVAIPAAATYSSGKVFIYDAAGNVLAESTTLSVSNPETSDTFSANLTPHPTIADVYTLSWSGATSDGVHIQFRNDSTNKNDFLAFYILDSNFQIPGLSASGFHNMGQFVNLIPYKNVSIKLNGYGPTSYNERPADLYSPEYYQSYNDGGINLMGYLIKQTPSGSINIRLANRDFTQYEYSHTMGMVPGISRQVANSSPNIGVIIKVTPYKRVSGSTPVTDDSKTRTLTANLNSEVAPAITRVKKTKPQGSEKNVTAFTLSGDDRDRYRLLMSQNIGVARSYVILSKDGGFVAKAPIDLWNKDFRLNAFRPSLTTIAPGRYKIHIVIEKDSIPPYAPGSAVGYKKGYFTVVGPGVDIDVVR